MRSVASRKASRIAALVALNALLAAAILVVPMARRADGQGMTGRARATYSMTGGNIAGSDMGVLHIIDETNQEMVSMMWNEKTKTLIPIGYRNLAQDSAGSTRVRP